MDEQAIESAIKELQKAAPELIGNCALVDAEGLEDGSSEEDQAIAVQRIYHQHCDYRHARLWEIANALYNSQVAASAIEGLDWLHFYKFRNKNQLLSLLINIFESEESNLDCKAEALWSLARLRHLFPESREHLAGLALEAMSHSYGYIRSMGIELSSTLMANRQRIEELVGDEEHGSMFTVGANAQQALEDLDMRSDDESDDSSDPVDPSARSFPLPKKPRLVPPTERLSQEEYWRRELQWYSTVYSKHDCSLLLVSQVDSERSERMLLKLVKRIDRCYCLHSEMLLRRIVKENRYDKVTAEAISRISEYRHSTGSEEIEFLLNIIDNEVYSPRCQTEAASKLVGFAYLANSEQRVRIAEIAQDSLKHPSSARRTAGIWLSKWLNSNIRRVQRLARTDNSPYRDGTVASEAQQALEEWAKE